jgi:hypothetical protein
MAGWTNRGKYNALGAVFRAIALPTNYFVCLEDQTTAPTQDTNTKADLTEIPNGNGYTTGGISLTKNSTDFDVYTEDDTNDWALIQIKDLVWTASGGNLPASGTGARYALLTDDNATQGSRQVWAYWDLVSNRTISDTQTLTLQNCELRITQ